MKRIAVLENTIQPYAWGSLTAIADLMGCSSPADQPQAELWMGAHPKAPSNVVLDGRTSSLADITAEDPVEMLGQKAADRFGNRIPYLFKVLAAAQPLSIQAHPDKTQAQKGFAAENRRNIPLDAGHRNYRDDNHKPECICALTPFWGLNGFRPIAETVDYLSRCCPNGLKNELGLLCDRSRPDRLKIFFTSLMSLRNETRHKVIDEALNQAQNRIDEDAAFRWVVALHAAYPSDIGVLAPLFLNLVCLEPGQAMFLQAGELHAYLDGLGIELMANSDNVLRGGLTPKHVDLPELLRVLNFDEKKIDILSPVKIREYELVYDTPAEEFRLSVVCLSADRSYLSPKRRSVEILLCTDGEAIMTDAGGKETLQVQKGKSVVVPAAVDRYRIDGQAVLYKAAVPIYHGENDE